MRINDQNGYGSTLPAETSGTSSVGRAGRDGEGNPARTSAAGSDSVQLSGVAGQVSRSLQTAGSRTERLSQLTEAVRSGAYRVDGAAVSRAMVAQALSASQAGGVS